MESTEKQDVWESFVSPQDILEEMGLLTGENESQGRVRKSEPYWSVKTHYPSVDKLFNGFKWGTSLESEESKRSGKVLLP